MAERWIPDKCFACGCTRRWGPHTWTDCVSALRERLEAVEADLANKSAPKSKPKREERGK